MTRELIAALVDDVPELKQLFAEHVELNGELLPHVFFGDLTRFVQTELGRGNADLVRRVLGALEGAAHSTEPSVRDLIGASFLENLDLDAQGWREMVRLAGPAMTLALARERRSRQNSK